MLITQPADNQTFPEVEIEFEKVFCAERGKMYCLFGLFTVGYDSRGGFWPVRIQLDYDRPEQGRAVLKPGTPLAYALAAAIQAKYGDKIIAAINRDRARGGHLLCFGEFLPNSSVRASRNLHPKNGYRRTPAVKRAPRRPALAQAG